jgi:hypothetical protein
MPNLQQFIEESGKNFDDWEHMGKQDVHLISPVSVRNTVKFLFLSQQLALVEKIKEMIESKRVIEKKNHTPNCIRGTDKYNHAYCEISGEDEQANLVLDDILQDLTIKN